MADRPGSRITITIGGLKRRIISVSESKSSSGKSKDDIYIDITSAEHAGGHFGPPGRVRQKRFTVHGAAWRGRGDNRINHVMEYEDRPSGKSLHYTKAILQGRFAPLLLQTFPDLSHPHYNWIPDPKKPELSLGEYNPGAFVLPVALFVGPAGGQILIPPGVNFSAQNITTRLYTVVVMWSFIGPLRSAEVGFALHPFTEDQDPDPERHDSFDTLQGGLDTLAVPGFFMTLSELCRLEACSRAYDPIGSILYSRFFHDGT